MSDRYPSKTISLDRHTFQLHGLSVDDAYWDGIGDDFEPEFQRICRYFIKTDYNCIDAGANIGLKTLYLSRHCSLGRVIAVEAGHDVAECLAANVRANDARNVVVVNAAISDHDGTINFAENSAWGRRAEDGVAVAATTLDTLVRDRQLATVDFLKIDVEGMEFSILKSALGVVSRFDTLVYMEFNSLGLLTWGDANPREFFEWLVKQFKYVFAINRDPSKDLLQSVDSDDQCWAFFHRNLVLDGYVTDLLFTNAEHRLSPTADHLKDQIDTGTAELARLRTALAGSRAELARSKTELAELATELTTLRTEHAAAMSDQDAVSADLKLRLQEATDERDALLASTSWRVSAPVRRLKRLYENDLKGRGPDRKA